MLLRTIACLAIGALLLIAAPGCVKESALTVAIHEDGTVTATSSMTFDRAFLEERLEDEEAAETRHSYRVSGDDDEDGELEMFAEFEDAAETADDEASDDAKSSDGEVVDSGEEHANGEEPPDPDAALAARIRSRIGEGAPKLDPDEGEFVIDAIEVEEEAVRLQVTFTFKTLEAFVTHVEKILNTSGVDRVLLDTDENGKLRLTLFPSLVHDSPGWTDYVMGTLLEAGYKGTYTFTMPGAIISSTLPTTDDDTTSIEIDADDDDGRDVLKNMFHEKTVIVAEPGTLVLEGLPLDSNVLAPRRPNLEVTTGLGGDVPITDAEDLYMAEPLYVTTTLVHVFAEAEDELEERVLEYVHESTSRCRVQAELYAPEDRIIAGVSDVRVTRAVDDQDREVKPYEPDSSGFGFDGSFHHFSSGDDQDNTFNFTVNLELPPHGATTIEEIEGELIATTFAEWKTHELPNPQTAPKTAIDVDDLVPGAKLYIGRIRDSSDEDGARGGSISIKIAGPPQISLIEAGIRIADDENSIHSYTSRSEMTTQGEHATRKLTLSYYHYSRGQDDDAKAPELTLVLKVRDNLKRERVKFLLEAVDLF